MLIIQASNIHETAGKILLIDLINSYYAQKTETNNMVLFIDKRCHIRQALPNLDIVIHEISATVLSRFIAELKIFSLCKKNTKARVFCFGNIPPLFTLPNQVILYYHTLLYFKKFIKHGLNLKQKIKLSLERQWIKTKLKGVAEVIVQSNFVKETFESEFMFHKIKILAFNDQHVIQKVLLNSKHKYQVDGFAYIAAGTVHKNHLNLIHAWRLLAKEGIYPKLHLTIDARYDSLLRALDEAQKIDQVNIINHGTVTHEDAIRLCLSASAVLFPSFCESLGLPLVEAKILKIPIIAGELDYVRDIVDPVETFDPNSPKSISRAVKRFLKITELKNEIETSEELVSYLKSSFGFI